MKNKVTGFMILALVGFFNGWLYAAADPYEDLADKLSVAGEQLVNKKMAIIPFSYADETSKSRDGAVISERLTMKMINLQKFEIIERSVLDKVMNELKLQSSGVIDASTAKQLGKVLGVDAIITGTLVRRTGGDIEVNARIIKTETAQAIGAAQIIVKKDWIGGDTPAVQLDAVKRPAYAKPTRKIPHVRGKDEYGFFDFFLGFGGNRMFLEFYNPKGNITLTSNANDSNNDLGINYSGGTVDVSRVTWESLETGAVGGCVELSIQRRNIKPQSTKWKLNNASEGNFTFNSEDYLTVTSIGFAGDLLIRHAGGKVEPYFGIGLGLSLNRLELPRVRGFTNTSSTSNMARPVEDFGLGLMFQLPVGMRIRAGKDLQLVTELRYELNSISFDRDIKYEEDKVTLKGVKFLLGMGFMF